MLLTGAPSLAAELAVGRESAVTGKQIMVPVKLKTENAAITALQFDVDYDAAVLSVSASLGPAAEKAGKRMTEGDPAKNRKRFMIFGLNHNLIEDGVVVELTIDIKAGAAGGEYALRCTSVVASTSTGARVEVRVVNGAVVVKNEP